MNEYDSIVIHKDDASDYAVVEELLDAYNVDVVYNLATKALPYSFINPEGAFSVNVEIANVLSRLLRKDKYKKLVHFSSSEVYGSAEQVPITEKHALHPTTPYAAGKASADLLLLAGVSSFGINASIIRLFNTYGPRQNEGAYAGLIPTTIRRILEGKKPIIEGSGRQTRDFIYVSDVVDAAIKMQSTRRGVLVQIASGKETSVRDVISAISTAMSYKEGVEKRPRRRGDLQRQVGAIHLAKRILGFSPRVSFQQGIKKTVDYYVKTGRRA